jgi:hypothetical protein
MADASSSPSSVKLTIDDMEGERVERLMLVLAAWTLISVPTGLALGRILRLGSGETGWVRSGAEELLQHGATASASRSWV